jgi:hypothetical protein
MSALKVTCVAVTLLFVLLGLLVLVSAASLCDSREIGGRRCRNSYILLET